MVQRRAAGQPARITFTHDFHELLTGDLCRGRPLQIAYDPLRIIPAEAPVKCGEPSRPVFLHARFIAGGNETTHALASPAGIVAAPQVGASRGGCFIEATLSIPNDADAIRLWFSYLAADGSEHRDDDFGTTFRFRFPCQDLSVDAAAVIPLPAGDRAALAIEVSTVAEVERMEVRYALLADAEQRATEVALTADETALADGRQRWRSEPLPVPAGAVVRFKLFYWIDGFRYKDDDGGHYYLAPDPEGEQAPPPPPSLIAAARAWTW